MGNAGQCCVAATRTFVEATIYEEMVERFRKLAQKRVLGDPFQPGVQQGPQVLFFPFILLFESSRQAQKK